MSTIGKRWKRETTKIEKFTKWKLNRLIEHSFIKTSISDLNNFSVLTYWLLTIIINYLNVKLFSKWTPTSFSTSFSTTFSFVDALSKTKGSRKWVDFSITSDSEFLSLAHWKSNGLSICKQSPSVTLPDLKMLFDVLEHLIRKFRSRITDLRLESPKSDWFCSVLRRNFQIGISNWKISNGYFQFKNSKLISMTE